MTNEAGSPTFENARVLVVGDVMLDRYWFGDVERISPEAPVPIVRVRREEHRLGGAANVALNAARLGARTQLMSVLGKDDAADRLRALLDEAGIDATLPTDPSIATTVKLRINGRSQQILRVDFEDRPAREPLAQLLMELEAQLDQTDVLVLSDYGKGGLDHVAAMIGQARERGVPSLVDPKGRDFSGYAGATLLTPNQQEFALAIGDWRDETELETLAQDARRALRLDAMLVTRSERGMSLFDGDGAFHVPAQAREVFDVTGAGDTVIATLAAAVGAGMTLRDAVVLANRAGALVVGKFGTAHITAEELFA